MKIVGLITEYNPFHNGHLYHILKAKEVTGADRVIVVMSGNFVQRGDPAIMPKQLRTEIALLSGASAVIELPVCVSCASAEYFAQGAVSLLDHLGCIDRICFGSECGVLEPLEQIAEILANEPEEYQDTLRKCIKSGLSYPSARQQALAHYLSSRKIRNLDLNLLLSPNNILGIEYLKALKKIGSSMNAYTIRRMDSGYHSTDLDSVFSSATAIRKSLQENSPLESIRSQVPDICFPLLEREFERQFPVYANDFSLLLKARLLTETSDTLPAYEDISEELANRILKNRNKFFSAEQFIQLLKTKELTYSRISRALFHILLGITKDAMQDFRRQNFSYYARILGFCAGEADVLTLINRHTKIPLITRPSAYTTEEKSAQLMFRQDCYAADLYESVITDKFGTPFQNELTRSVLKQ